MSVASWFVLIGSLLGWVWPLVLVAQDRVRSRLVGALLVLFLSWLGFLLFKTVVLPAQRA